MPILEHVADRPARIDAERIAALGADLRADDEIEQASQQRDDDLSRTELPASGHGRALLRRQR